jgi:hypothetical protein
MYKIKEKEEKKWGKNGEENGRRKERGKEE